MVDSQKRFTRRVDETRGDRGAGAHGLPMTATASHECGVPPINNSPTSLHPRHIHHDLLSLWRSQAPSSFLRVCLLENSQAWQRPGSQPRRGKRLDATLPMAPTNVNQFIQRQRVISLWREIVRALYSQFKSSEIPMKACG